MRASLLRADFSGANLAHAALHDTDLRGARFGSANLSVASLVCAKLEGADLSRANCQDALFPGATYHDATELPDHPFDPKREGMKRSTSD